MNPLDNLPELVKDRSTRLVRHLEAKCESRCSIAGLFVFSSQADNPLGLYKLSHWARTHVPDSDKRPIEFAIVVEPDIGEMWIVARIRKENGNLSPILLLIDPAKRLLLGRMAAEHGLVAPYFDKRALSAGQRAAVFDRYESGSAKPTCWWAPVQDSFALGRSTRQDTALKSEARLVIRQLEQRAGFPAEAELQSIGYLAMRRAA